MDNRGFVADEQLSVVDFSEGHHEGRAVYSSGRCLQACAYVADVGTKEAGVLPAQKHTHCDKMPTSYMEETALLRMDDVELKNIKIRFPSSLRQAATGCVETRVRTNHGDILVAVQGDRAKPAILTYHDVGLNYLSFQTFFNYVDMRALLENFCIYHVNAPGQEEGAPTLPANYSYPSMFDLANQLNYVLAHFDLRSCIGLGVGAGAYILTKFALSHPDKVDALALINCSSRRAGWYDWACYKWYGWSLRTRGMTNDMVDYLMWHHFGRYPEQRNPDLVSVYRGYFYRNTNPTNLSLLADSYLAREDLGIDRAGTTLRVPVLNITGADSPQINETVVFNGRLNPNISTWMKISDCAMVLEEQPGKASEAFRLFLQGEGYAVLALQNLSRRSSQISRHSGVGVNSFFLCTML